MSAYVEECRREWKRLGVPDFLADEMATDLEADLAEAEAEGTPAAEVLGESDPRQFAAAWARERGLVSEIPPKQRSRKRLWIGLAVGLVLLGFLLGIGGVAVFAKPTVSVSREQTVHGSPPRLVRVPLLVGVQLCHAQHVAQAHGFHLVIKVRESQCRGNVVVRQRPTAHALVPRHWPMALRTRLDPVRVPNLVGRSEGVAEDILDRLGLHVRHYVNLPLRLRLRLRLEERRVVGQIPAAGQTLQPPHAVTVRLHPRYPLAPVRVPDLVGRSECTAEDILNRLGLYLPRYPTSSVCNRRIVSQIPAAGQTLLPPHAVTVRLRPTKR